MSWTTKVTWSEGLFLRPQLFQQQERYLEHFAHKRALPLTPFYWGFSHLRIDKESLALGKLVLASSHGLFADGTPFDLPGQTPAPAPLMLLPEHLNQVIHLALPIRTPNGEETCFQDTTASMARFSVFESELRDANSIGQGPKPVQLSQLRLRLVPDKELSAAWMGLPLARVKALHRDGRAEVDSEFIAPINSHGASSALVRWITQIHGTLQQRAHALAQRLSGEAGSGAQTAEVTDFLLLQILNRYDPQLEHLLAVHETSPESAYLLLRSLASELSTFMRIDTRRPRPHPAYQHGDPYATFKALVEDTRQLLNSLLVRSAQSIPFERKAHGMRSTSVDPSELKSFESLVLAVSAQMSLEQIAKVFPGQSKLGPSDRLPEQVRLHLPGLALSVLPVPPRQIPFNAGVVYFQVEAKGPMWEHMLTHGGISLHMAADLPGLHIELWGIR